MLIRCILVSLFLISACSSDDDQQWSVMNLAGFYKVTSGTQYIVEDTGVSETRVFTEDEGSFLSVRQTGDIVSIFECSGVPDKDLKYTCSGSVYDFDAWAGAYYLDVQGIVAFFKDKTAKITIQIFGVFPNAYLTYTSILDVKLVFDEKTTTDTKAGVVGG